MIPVLGFAPDIDPATPGVLVDCDGMVPTVRGMRGMDSPTFAGLPVLSTRVIGAANLRKVDGTKRIFAGLAASLHEAGATFWTDVSKSGGYTGNDAGRWRFTQFGNVTIATNKIDTMQSSTTGAFADLGGTPPKAALIDSVGLAEGVFVFAADTNDGVDDLANRWWCSALGNHADWVPSIATQSANGRLTDTPDGIVGLRKLGTKIVMYKEKSMYVADYVGPPIIWGLSLMSNTIGALSNECIVDVGDGHYFIGPDNFYYFDGSRPVPLDPPVREFFFSDYSFAERRSILSLHDYDDNVIHWIYPSNIAGSSLSDSIISFHYRANKWGRTTVASLFPGTVLSGIEFPLEFGATGITWNAMGDLFATWDDLPQIPYDSPFWLGSLGKPGFFDNTHLLQILRGAPKVTYLVTGDHGDENVETYIYRVRPRFNIKPDTADLLSFHRRNTGDALRLGNAASGASGKFDFRRVAHWQRFKMQFTGKVEVLGWEVSAKPRGANR